MGVNVPNFGPGTAPGLLRRWAQTVEGLGFDLLMISDHIAVTPDVAEQYPPPAPSCSIRSTPTRARRITRRPPGTRSRRCQRAPVTWGRSHDRRGHRGRPAVS